jgi:hypothetical protein
MIGGQALTQTSTQDLRLLLTRLHRGELRAPITHDRLVVAGLPHLVDKIGFLHGLDEAAARAVLVAVIAERRVVEERAARGAR